MQTNLRIPPSIFCRSLQVVNAKMNFSVTHLLWPCYRHPFLWSDPFFTPRQYILFVIHGPLLSTETCPPSDIRPQIPQVIAQAVAIPVT